MNSLSSREATIIDAVSIWKHWSQSKYRVIAHEKTHTEGGDTIESLNVDESITIGILYFSGMMNLMKIMGFNSTFMQGDLKIYCDNMFYRIHRAPRNKVISYIQLTEELFIGKDAKVYVLEDKKDQSYLNDESVLTLVRINEAMENVVKPKED